MKSRLMHFLIALGVLGLTGCATVAGTAVGAGIGSIAGDTRAGALIGGGAGLLYDVFD
jgi:hypothetical protein